jgi:hypothetical protein
MSDLPCINPDVSLFDLIHLKKQIKGKITIAQLSGKNRSEKINITKIMMRRLFEMKKCTTYTLGETIIVQKYDDTPDTSNYGKYTEKYQPGCIIRRNRTFYEDHIDDDDYDPPRMNREYSFFQPYASGEKIESSEYRKYALQDYEAMESLNNQQWTYICLDVKTFIHTDSGLSDHVQNSLCSIEDHWDKESREYKEEVVRDLISENIVELSKMGFSMDEIKKSTDNPKYPKEW